MTKEFDLNIEKILENWEIYHAVREIIANALDEQKLTGTKDISIRTLLKSYAQELYTEKQTFVQCLKTVL